MEVCFHKDCEKEGVHYRDYTITGIGDIRHFCDDHVEAHDYEQKIRGMFSDVHYRLGEMDRRLTEAKAQKDALRVEFMALQNLQLWKNGPK